jgi:DNA ligase-1
MEIMGSKQERKTGLLYNVFDCVPLSQFKAGKCSASASNRKKWFLEKYTKEWTFGGYEHVKPLPVIYEGVYREEAVKGFHQNILRRGGEGIMINIASAPYECKRTANLLKVKEMYTMDLKIIGFEEGLVGSKFEGTLGAIVVDYKGHEVKVGSGYTDDERKFFWENKDDLIGRVTEVQYFEETEDTDGNLSLRFPVYVQLREFGKEVSYD